MQNHFVAVVISETCISKNEVLQFIREYYVIFSVHEIKTIEILFLPPVQFLPRIYCCILDSIATMLKYIVFHASYKLSTSES